MKETKAISKKSICPHCGHLDPAVLLKLKIDNEKAYVFLVLLLEGYTMKTAIQFSGIAVNRAKQLKKILTEQGHKKWVHRVQKEIKARRKTR